MLHDGGVCVGGKPSFLEAEISRQMHRSEKCGEGRTILVWCVDGNIGGEKAGVPPKPLHSENDRTFVAFRRRLHAKIVR